MNLNLKIRNSMDFKVSLGGFGGSKGGGSNEAKSAIGIEALAGGHVLGDTGGAYSLTLWNCWQETNADVKTTATVTAAPTAPCLLIVAAMCRDEVSIDGDGWTKVVESVVAE